MNLADPKHALNVVNAHQVLLRRLTVHLLDHVNGLLAALSANAYVSRPLF